MAWLDWSSINNVLLILNIVFVLTVIIFERRNPTATLTWVLALLFIPVIGFLFYLFFGQDLRKKRLFYFKEEEERIYLSALEQQQQSINNESTFFNHEYTGNYLDLINMQINSNKAFYTQNNHVKIFNSGPQLFPALLSSIMAARHFIHVEYYIINNDTLGRQFLDALVAKAEEGLEVKLVYDGIGCARVSKKFFRRLEKAGGVVVEFYPPFIPYLSTRINYRNHRKICVIDGREAYMGGFNIGDEYNGNSKDFSFWRDTHLQIVGEAVNSLELRFFLDWRYAADEHCDYNASHYPVIPENSGKTGIQIVSSGPDSKWPSIKHGYLQLINKARKSVYIQTPYFIPDETILESLKTAALSGIDVRLMIPDKGDHAFIHWATLSYIGELLEAGVRVYRYYKGFLHSKVVISDAFAASVGTANFDIRSFKLNFEVNAFIFDPKLGQELFDEFKKDIIECHEVKLVDYDRRTRLSKFEEAFARILSPLL